MEEQRESAARPDRRRFYAALAVFFLWVAALGAMAVVSGRRPAQNPAAIENR